MSTKRIDGRTTRKTGRTVQFATRVTPEFDKTIRRIAKQEHLKIVEVLEMSLALYQHVKRSKTDKVIYVPPENSGQISAS